MFFKKIDINLGNDPVIMIGAEPDTDRKLENAVVNNLF